MPELPQRAVGVDVGGTSVKLGVVDRSGSVLSERSWEVPAEVETQSYLDDLAEEVSELLADDTSHASSVPLGLGLPGLLDRPRGRVLISPNLPYLSGVSVRDELARRLDRAACTIRVENDANVAALGERWSGAAADETNVLVLTLGTGIGGGIILDGKLVTGEGQAGEIGHVTVDPEGLPCGCGSRGCLETLASASAASRRARERGLPSKRPGDLEALAARARVAAGPERELLFAVGRDLGHGLAHVVCLLDVRAFVFGGGFSAALDTLSDGIRTGLAEWAYGERVADVRLVRATLGARAGWIGAASLSLFDPP